MSLEKDDLWVSRHFEELVEKYGGSYVAISGERVVALAKGAKEAHDKAKEAVGDVQITLLKVPREEELVCLL